MRTRIEAHFKSKFHGKTICREKKKAQHENNIYIVLDAIGRQTDMRQKYYLGAYTRIHGLIYLFSGTVMSVVLHLSFYKALWF